MSSTGVRPFILRAEVTRTTEQDAARRRTILAELTDADLDRVAGGTNNCLDCAPTWDPSNGGGTECKYRDPCPPPWNGS